MEITAAIAQTVSSNQNVLFTDEAVVNNGCTILHRQGSGLVTLRSLPYQRRTRYKVSFSGNVSLPSIGTAAPIYLAIAINGEGLNTAAMIATPAAVSEYSNVSAETLIDVPQGCCSIVSIKNTGSADVLVQNANLIIERVF